VESFRRAFEGPHAPDAAMGAYLSSQQQPAARYAQLEFEERYALMQRAPTIDFIATYSAAYRREVFLEAGGFDSAFPKANNEDAEFSYRLHSMGKRIAFVPDARVEHEHDETWTEYLRLKIGRGYWRTIVYRRFPGKGLKDSYTPQLMKLQMPLALLATLAVLRALLGASPRRLLGALPFVLSTLPMVGFARRHANPALRATAIWATWGSYVRALAFVIGVAQALLTGGVLGTARTGALEPEIAPAPAPAATREEPRP
ncbi:MAG: glycosyltransferase family 2 protein, partial [Caldilineaceae bacterium]